MNRSITAILIITGIFISCRQSKKIEIENIGDTVTNQNEVRKSDDWSKFELIFTYENTNVTQKLGVNILKPDSIEFFLVTKEGSCSTHYRGTAINLYPDMDGEFDEDENGEGYAATEFIKEDDLQIIKIRISETNNRAKIIFEDKSHSDAGCRSASGLLLKNANSN